MSEFVAINGPYILPIRVSSCSRLYQLSSAPRMSVVCTRYELAIIMSWIGLTREKLNNLRIKYMTRLCPITKEINVREMLDIDDISM